MAVEIRHEKPTLLKIGFVLVAASYILLAPTFLFVAVGVGGKAWFWCRLAAATYVVSWILLIAGVLMAGRDAARLGHRWGVKLLRRKATLRQTTDSIGPSEGAASDVE